MVKEPFCGLWCCSSQVLVVCYGAGDVSSNDDVGEGTGNGRVYCQVKCSPVINDPGIAVDEG